MFESNAPEAPRKTRAELMKDIDAAYYGFRDDDDGLLVPLEVEAEKAAIEAAVKEWKEKREAGKLTFIPLLFNVIFRVSISCISQFSGSKID